jgi:hypothetical protein
VANRLVNLVLPSAPLGVPWFKMAEVPTALIEGSARKDARDLGAGMVFASLRIEGGQELNWSAAQGWPEETMALLLLLDLWLQNEDRSLSALGGNPNLLVEQIPPLRDDDPEGALWKDQPRREMLWAYGGSDDPVLTPCVAALQACQQRLPVAPPAKRWMRRFWKTQGPNVVLGSRHGAGDDNRWFRCVAPRLHSTDRLISPKPPA